MAKTRAPLLSFGGSGQIGKTMVASSWRGVKYMREYVKPANPRTTAQQGVRSVFALLGEMWKLAPSIQFEPWNAFAKGRPFTGRNKYIGENVRVLNGQPDFANFIGSPGSGGGVPPTSISAADAGGQVITVTFVNPAAPDGWMLTAAQAVAFQDQDPAGFFTGPYIGGQDIAAPIDTVSLDVGEAGDYVVAGWLKWTKPDGSFAYSVSLLDTITVA